MSFTQMDNVIAGESQIEGEEIENQLRRNIDDLRSRLGLASWNWSEHDVDDGITLAGDEDITELVDALDEAHTNNNCVDCTDHSYDSTQNIIDSHDGTVDSQDIYRSSDDGTYDSSEDGTYDSTEDSEDHHDSQCHNDGYNV